MPLVEFTLFQRFWSGVQSEDNLFLSSICHKDPGKDQRYFSVCSDYYHCHVLYTLLCIGDTTVKDFSIKHDFSHWISDFLLVFPWQILEWFIITLSSWLAIGPQGDHPSFWQVLFLFLLGVKIPYSQDQQVTPARELV